VPQVRPSLLVDISTAGPRQTQGHDTGGGLMTYFLGDDEDIDHDEEDDEDFDDEDEESDEEDDEDDEEEEETWQVVA
jgi:hypothetical protein